MQTPTPHGRGRPPAADPQAKAKLAFLAQLLAEADEEARRRADLITAGACRMGGGGATACRLVEVVCRGRLAEARRAAAALVEMGPPAQWPVLRWLLRSRRVKDQLRLLEVLGALAPLLGQDARTGLVRLLAPFLSGAKDRALAEALQGVMGLMRARLDVGAGAVDAAGAAPATGGGACP
jgi:hypothetical protein